MSGIYCAVAASHNENHARTAWGAITLETTPQMPHGAKVTWDHRNRARLHGYDCVNLLLLNLHYVAMCAWCNRSGPQPWLLLITFSPAFPSNFFTGSSYLETGILVLQTKKTFISDYKVARVKRLKPDRRDAKTQSRKWLCEFGVSVCLWGYVCVCCGRAGEVCFERNAILGSSFLK